MRWINFSGKIKIIGVNPYILISKEIAEKIKFNWKKPIPVIVKINELPKQGHCINLVPIGNGDFYLYLNQIVRDASNTKVEDLVEISIKFDENYKNGPMHDMPEWFKKMLDKNKFASKNWVSLIPSRQKEILRYFSRIKSEEAIERNLTKITAALSGKKIRFMGREWTNAR
jgi:hypothetical protein